MTRAGEAHEALEALTTVDRHPERRWRVVVAELDPSGREAQLRAGDSNVERGHVGGGGGHLRGVGQHALHVGVVPRAGGMREGDRAEVDDDPKRPIRLRARPS